MKIIVRKFALHVWCLLRSASMEVSVKNQNSFLTSGLRARHNLLLMSLVVLLLSAGTGIAAATNINDLLVKVEAVQELKTDGTAKVESIQQKAGEGVKRTEMIYYERDSDHAFLIVLTAPEVEKGNGYLKLGDNTWMYRRNTRSFQHVNRDESIAGTDAKVGDFENKKLIELYKPLVKAGQEALTETKLGDKAVYKFEITARTEDVTYPKQVYWVEKASYLPLKIQSYSLSGTLMQTAYFIKYTPVQGKYIWTKAIFVDEFEKGNKTIMELKSISLRKIDDKVFTKAYLENLSK